MSGVLIVNSGLLAVGFCVLAPALGGFRPTWAGVALLVGAAVVGLGLVFAAVLGASTGPWTFAAVAGLLAVAGLVAAKVVPRERLAPSDPPLRPREPLGEAVTAAAAAAVGVLALALLIGSFRSSPWLDDAWGIWLPKGIALSHHGLDERLFVPNDEFVHFEVPDYPLWWSALTGLDVRLAGEVDVRAMNAQLGILAVAFLAGAARLLWGWVRPWVLWASLLLLAASPEFLRHTQSGMADLPLAIFLSLSLLAGVGWIVSGRLFYAALVVVFGAAAAAAKTEGLPELVLLLGVLGLFAPRRRVGLWLSGLAASAAAVPWLAWRAAHDVEGRVAFRDGLDLDRADRLGPGVEGLLSHLFDPTEWLLIVPVALAIALVGFARERRAAWLALPALLSAGFLFLAWAYWADRDEIDFLVATSAYRVVDPLLLTAALAVPVLAERLLAERAR
jgi:hypothetical protein